MYLLLLLALAGLLHGAHSFVPEGELQAPAYSASLAFGFVLLAALFAGKLVERFKMPQLTGYLLAGLVVGPYATRLLTEDMLQALSLVDGTAVSLIALTAGGELNLRKLKPLLGVVRSMIGFGVVLGSLGLTLVVLALSPWLDLFDGMTLLQRFSVAVVLGITLASQSPAVVIALLNETRSEGPLSQLMLALVVLSDLLVIFLFALASTAANATFAGEVEPGHALGLVAWEIFGSMGAGLAVGLLLTLFLKHVESGKSLFVLLLSACVAELGRRLHLDPLIVMLVAGVFLENLTPISATALIHDIEAVSLPVYLIFFAVAGAILRLDLLVGVLGPALILCLARALVFWWGTRVAGKRSNAPPSVTRYTWVGLLPQAGLALALAILLKRSFPSFGAAASLLILSVVGINQLVTPVLLRVALGRSGEAGKKLDTDMNPAPQPITPGTEIPTESA
jgi:Kef-type K+ transport system membrane component KefB